MQVSIARKCRALLASVAQHRVAALAALSIAGCLGLPSAVRAATLTVTSTADDGSAGTLRSLVQSAASGDTIVFSPSVFATYQTIVLTQGAITVNKNLTITGPPVHVALDAGHLSQVMAVTPPCLDFHMSNMTLLNGYATNGGGISLDTIKVSSRGGTVGGGSLSNCEFAGCQATNEGGGLFVDAGLINIDHCIFRGNSAKSGGGMLNAFFEQFARVNVSACTFYGNVAQSGGGGAYNRDRATFVNCTFYANAASVLGGGVESFGYPNSDVATITYLFNCTIDGNYAPSGGGVAVTGGRSVAIQDSIVYGDATGEIYDPTDILTASYSDIQGGYSGAGNIDADPLLGPLADNGGLVPTMALFPGSPCIGAVPFGGGTDARGVVRPNPSCMGAYEFTAGPELTSVSLDSILAGSTGVTLTLTGTGFIPSSVVLWNGVEIPTTFVSPTELTASIPDADVAATGTAEVIVDSPTTGQESSSLTVSIVPDAVSSLTLAPTQVVGGKSSTATLTLLRPAPTNLVIPLSSSDTQVASVRHTVTVPAGATSVKFKVTTYPVAANSDVTISATYGGTVSATLTVTPPEVKSLKLHPATIFSSGSTTATVILNGQTAVDTPVHVTVSDPAAVHVNGPVIVPAGQDRTTFTVDALSVSTRVSVTLDASASTATAQATLRILPRH